MSFVIGIDATNLRQGGGRTHLIEVLRTSRPELHGFSKIIVWGSDDTLRLLESYPWLEKKSHPALMGGLFARTLWQCLILTKKARKSRCDLLFVPGGSYFGNFHPVVTMSRNMLPFEWKELSRYKRSIFIFKLLLLRLAQIKTFKKVDGLIFLSKYAKNIIINFIDKLPDSTIIPHGLNERFKAVPRLQKSIHGYSDNNPYRLLYVSTIDEYKHQWHVIKAIELIRREEKWNIALDLVGPAFKPSLIRLKKSMMSSDPQGVWINYWGEVPFQSLHKIYLKTDLGIFASSCENMPNTLLEMMAAGLPIACSRLGPMPDFLGVAGLYFNPEDPRDIADTLKRLIGDENLRKNLSLKSFNLSLQYTWVRCADETFTYLKKIGKMYK